MNTQPNWQPCREPLRSVILRTGTIAIVIGAAIASFRGGLVRWPLATLLVLWPAFGGHWVEVWFLNWLRPRISSARSVQASARVCVWFLAGIGFVYAMRLTANAITGQHFMRWSIWWIGGFGFIGVELIAHAVMQISGRPNFYNGLG